MRQKPSGSDKALYRAVDEVLHYVWDPIGVSDVPQARDEYHGYLPQVFGMLQSGADEHAIASYLSNVSTERMGLKGNIEHDRKVARALINWRAALRDQHA